tara:strand:- start:170753 stop:171994 length:1242 start_codon:yes stop_codon:yes gene_type:complete
MAETRMSKLVKKVQKEYADKSNSHPILIIDKDELNWKIARARAFGEENKEIRNKLIADYVKEKSGVEIKYNDSINLDTYISFLKNSAVAVPLTTGMWTSKVYKICTVFHADPNSNRRLETERLLGLNSKEAYGDLTYDQLAPMLNFDQLKKFSLYHELAHCLDKKYLPEAQDSFDDSHGIHESESFAETAGLLLLAREGELNLAQKRIEMRSIYAKKMGHFFVDNPQTGFGNPNAKFGGMIYYLAPVLEAGKSLIDTDLESLKTSSIDEILNLSKDIVENHALDSREFHGIYVYMDRGLEAMEATYRGYEESMPEFFEGVLDSIFGFVNNTQRIVDESFDMSRGPLPIIGELLPLSIEKDFCPSYLAGDRNEFEIQLETFREDLEKENGSADAQRARQKQLMDIHETVSVKCK